MESWKQKTYYNHRPNGGSKAEPTCKKHPKHTQSPGVCSVCLNEKLSKVTNANNGTSSRAKARRFPSSDLSSLSSSTPSSNSSPVVIHSRRLDPKARRSVRVFKNFNSGKDLLKKSRSMTFVLQRRSNDSDDGKKGKSVETKRGFWSKLLKRRNKGLMHSRTTRERVVITTHVQY